LSELYILIADDDADDRFLIANAFKKVWPEAILKIVDNGQQVIDSLWGDEVDITKQVLMPGLIIMDINMPVKDGIAALKEIKQHKTYKGIPVIIFSGTTNRDFITQAYTYGANTFICKPTLFDGYYKIFETVKAYWANTAAIS
jgi:CheY-like chemotaxis protein